MTAVDATSAIVVHPESSTGRLRLAQAGFLAGYGPGTRQSYTDGLSQWFAWCQQTGTDPLHAERPHIELWGRHLEEQRRLARTTVAHRLVTLRAFYKYCADEGHTDRDPSARVRLPKCSPESTTHGMTRQETVAFLLASERNPTQHALVCLLLLNGLRISEACNADIEELGVDSGHRTLRVVRKGGKRQRVPLSAKTARAVDAAIGDRTTGPVLLTRHGTRLTRRRGEEIVDLIGRKVGLPYHVHPHMLRHMFATTALGAGAPLHDVQDSMGHADPRSTRRYDRNRESLDRNSTHLVSAMLTYR